MLDGATSTRGAAGLSGMGVSSQRREDRRCTGAVPHHHVADGAHGLLADHRHRAERNLRRVDVRQPARQFHDLRVVQALIHAHAGEHGGNERRGPAGVQQHRGTRGFVHHAGHESLLALHPADVGGGVELPGAHVGQGIAALEGRTSRRQLQPRGRVVDVRRHADVDPAEGVDHLDEAREVDLEVVVDPYAGGVLHGLHEQRRAAVGVCAVELLLRGIVLLAVLVGVRRDRGQRVPRQAHDTDRPVGPDVGQHHGVGALAVDVPAGVQPSHLPVGQALPAVGPDHQECQGVAGGRCLALIGERVDALDLAGVVLHGRPAGTAAEQDGGGGNRGEQTRWATELHCGDPFHRTDSTVTSMSLIPGYPATVRLPLVASSTVGGDGSP